MARYVVDRDDPRVIEATGISAAVEQYVDAPAPTTVPAPLVRAYLAAVTDHRRALASAMQPCISEPLAVIDARAALVAALERCP